MSSLSHSYTMLERMRCGLCDIYLLADLGFNGREVARSMRYGPCNMNIIISSKTISLMILTFSNGL